MTTVYNHTIYEFAVRNGSGEEIPAFAVMQPTAPVGSSGRLVFPVVKPGSPEGASGWPRFYLINGPFVIPIGGSGNGTRAKADNPAIALREDKDVRYGAYWGAVDGSWKLDLVYMGGYIALGPESNVGAETKTLFHSEGPNEPFLVEINGYLEEDDQPGEGQIMEQTPFYTITEDEIDYNYGGGFVGIGRNIELWCFNLPDHAKLSGQVWVQRNSQTGAYNVLENNQSYIPRVSADKLAAASPTDPVALVSEL